MSDCDGGSLFDVVRHVSIARSPSGGWEVSMAAEHGSPVYVFACATLAQALDLVSRKLDGERKKI